MMCHRKTGRQQANPYAKVADFCRLFTKGMSELDQLSFLLTADHQEAEQCFVAGLEESMRCNGVFKEWARSWAKRAIVPNAIGQLKPHPSTASSSTFTVPPDGRRLSTGEERHVGLNAVPALPDFEWLLAWGNPGSTSPGRRTNGKLKGRGSDRRRVRKSSGASSMTYRG